MRIIRQIGGLKANGHYALAISDENRVYVSGQFSVDLQSGQKKYGSIEEEVEQILNNIELILKQTGSDRSKVLRATIYICDLNLWPDVDKTYAEFFGDHTPARTVVAVKELHYGFKAEIEVIASC